MNPSEKQIRTAAKMYEARDTVRLLLGDRYPATMKKLGAELSRMAVDTGEDVLSVALALCKAATNAGKAGAALQILAAAVELSEPSQGVKP